MTFTHGHAEYKDEYDDEDEGKLFALLDTRKDRLLISPLCASQGEKRGWLDSVVLRELEY